MRASYSGLDMDAETREQFDREGWAVLPAVLSPAEITEARAALARAAERSEASGMPTRMDALDPGGRNLRVYDLVEHDPLFRELAVHPLVVDCVDALLGPDTLLSNFTANTALPGSGSMNAHCDQSTIMPEPWPVMHAMNAIWCLHDTDEENGATRYLPGSHAFTCFDEVPDDPKQGMRAFEARAGSVLLMHGRLWHTSGENRSADRERSLLFAFYARSFLSTQSNWYERLSEATRRDLSAPLRRRLGLGLSNMAHGAYLAGPGER